MPEPLSVRGLSPTFYIEPRFIYRPDFPVLATTQHKCWTSPGQAQRICGLPPVSVRLVGHLCFQGGFVQHPRGVGAVRPFLCVAQSPRWKPPGRRFGLNLSKSCREDRRFLATGGVGADAGELSGSDFQGLPSPRRLRGCKKITMPTAAAEMTCWKARPCAPGP